MVKHDNVIVCDIDGTLTQDKGELSYSDVPPRTEVVKRLQELKAKGFWIILNSSRNMRTHNGNIGLILKHTTPILLDWLNKHRVPYDELHLGKPWCGNSGFYVDDRSIRPREFVELSLEEIEYVLNRDRDFS